MMFPAIRTKGIEKRPMSRCSPPWTERCVKNRLKSSASSVPTWIVLNCANSILESLILATAEKYLPQLNLVMTAPGIQSFAAIGIISEIGVDMSVFPTSKHLCSWAGLTPQNNESAGKKKTTRISRAGAYIKPLACSVRSQCDSCQAVSRSPQSLSCTQETPGTQESHYRHCQDVAHGHLQHAQEERAVQP